MELYTILLLHILSSPGLLVVKVTLIDNVILVNPGLGACFWGADMQRRSTDRHILMGDTWVVQTHLN